MLANGGWDLTLILLTWTIWRAPTNASKWLMGFNSALKGLISTASSLRLIRATYLCISPLFDVQLCLVCLVFILITPQQYSVPENCQIWYCLWLSLVPQEDATIDNDRVQPCSSEFPFIFIYQIAERRCQLIILPNERKVSVGSASSSEGLWSQSKIWNCRWSGNNWLSTRQIWLSDFQHSEAPFLHMEQGLVHSRVSSNKNDYQGYLLGGKGGRCVGVTTSPPLHVYRNSGILNFLEPSGSVQACNGWYSFKSCTRVVPKVMSNSFL